MERLPWRRLGALWLVGLNLRMTILALPPLLPLISRDFGLSQTMVAALTTLPVLLLAGGAPLGSAVIARIGPRATIIAGLAVIIVASALRGGAVQAWALFALTFLTGLGIAVIQPALPALIQRWLPRAAGFATATYLNGLLLGELLAASLTLPVVLPLAGSWRAALPVWSLPALLAIPLLWVFRDGRPVKVAARWWPDWGRSLTWWLGLLQAAVSTLYFAANTFLPTYLHATGSPDLVGPSLTVLNAAQLPASLLLAVLPTRWITGVPCRVVLGVGGAAGVLLIIAGSGPLVLTGAGLIGFTTAAGLIVAFALPVMLAGVGEAHRVSAGMLTIGYALAFLLPLAGGAAWDASGVPALAFLPALCGAFGIIALPVTRGRDNPAE